MTFAERARNIDAAPYIERPAKPTPKERYPTKDEIQRLIDSADAPHMALAIHLLGVGAILDLTWDRVDLARGIINLGLDDARTRKGRAIVPINQGLLAALQTGKASAMSDYVIERGGNRIGSIRKGFEGAVRRSGLTDVTQHTIRHSAAVQMVSSGPWRKWPSTSGTATPASPSRPMGFSL
ncbi:tyrosine-type recombinase/integrase [Paracoccus beibuensis]|uniref:tyrosine-type recombinase/integrase n=1 Tax=Paracoccus beibuensis TaxID=547602 RepID=UPI0022404990|nr:tyrosine-type recombinase/integrase [Paracoccus beibuensis]